MKKESDESAHFEIDAEDLPDNWCISTMGEIADVVAGGTPTASDETNFSDEGYPWITPADLSNFHLRYIQRGKRSLSEKGLKTSAAKMLPKGTVLMSSRAPIGYVAIAANPISTNQGFKNFICHDGIFPEFVYYWIKYLNPYLEGMGSGSTFMEISGTRAKKIPFIHPPLPEQQRIVARIEALLAHVNEARGQLQRVPAVMKQFRQGVLAAACSGRLTEGWREENPDVEPASHLLLKIKKSRDLLIKAKSKHPIKNQTEDIKSAGQELTDIPDSWSWCRVQDIVQVQLGGTPSRKESSYWGGEIPWVSSGEVANNRISSTREKITKSGLENSNAKLYAEGTVLIAMIGEGKTRGQSAILEITATTNQNVAGLVFDTEFISNEFVWLWALGQYEKTRAVGRGGEQPALNGEKIRNLSLALPPLAEQHEIVRRVGALFARADAVEREVAAATKRTEALTQAVLAKAFSGKL